MGKLTQFLQNEGFYDMTSEEKDEILELVEVKEEGSYKDPEKKKSLFERVKDVFKKDN